MAINISHPTNTIDGQDVLNIKSGNESNIELSPDSGLVNVNGDINITGNFRVQGTTTTVNSTTTTIVDPIIALGTDEDGNPVNYNDGKDRGISFFYNNGSNKTGFFGFDSSNNDFRFIPDATINSEVVSGADGTITINRLNSADIYTDYLDATADVSIHGNLTVDNNTITTTLDAGNLNVTENIISSTISGNIVLDPGEDSIDASNSNIINLAEPSNSQDAATKNYVDQKSNAISVLNIAGDFGTGSVDLETGTFTLNGTEYQIETSVSNDVITFSLPTNLIVPGSLEVSTGLTVKGDTQIDGNLNVDGNITLGGNITIGDQTIDTVNIVADFTSNLIPQVDVTYDLGSETKRWNNVYAGTINADLVGNITGNVTGQVSDISNHTTDELTEGETNLYYTTERVLNELSANDTGGDGSFSYNNATGVFTYTGPSATETQAHFSAGTGLTYNAGQYSITNTGVVSGEYGNSSSIPILTINEQGQITNVTTTSVAGVTDFTYNTSNANLTIYTADENSFVATVTLDPFTTDNLAEGEGSLYYTSGRVLSEFSAGTGVYYDNTTGVISIGQSVDTTSDVTFNSVTVTTNTTTDTLDAGNLNITTNVISSDIAGDIIIDSGADKIQLIGDTDVTGNLAVSADTVIYGNLTVQGTTTSVNSTTVDIADLNITIAKDAANATEANGAGITVDGANATITYTSIDDTWNLNKTLNVDGNVNANSFYGDLTGNVTGQVSDISNHTTDELTEGETNLYYTTERTRSDVKAGTGLTYTQSTGEFKISNTGVTADTYGSSSNVPVITINEQGQITSASTIAVAGVTDFTYNTTTADLTIYTADNNTFVATVTLDPFTTDNLTEGDNLYYTTARANTDFDTRLATKTTDDLTEGLLNKYYTSQRVRDELSAGTGVYYDNTTGVISIGQSVDTNSDVTFNSVTVSTNTTTDTLDAGNLNITTNVISSDISGDIRIESGNDNIELVGNTNVTGDLTVSGMIYGDLTGNVTGQVSDISNHTTTELEEGNNLYYTSERVLNELSAGTGVYYDNATGVISIGQSVDTDSNVTLNDLFLTGNLTVQGTTTSVNSTTVDIADKNLTLAKGSANANQANGAGITVDGANATITYISATDSWDFNKTVKASEFIGDLTGNVTGQVSDISNHTTDELTEGETNLYYTTARANTDFDTRLATKTTDNLTEGNNLYYTSQRVRDELSVNDAGGDGSFSYDNSTGVFTYTGPSASETQAHFSAGTGLTYDTGEFSITNTGVVSGEYGSSSNIPVITINEQGQITSATTIAVAGVTDFTYNTTNGNLTIDTADGGSFVATVTLDPFTTDTLTEGETNLYYTSQRVRDELSAGTGVYYDNTTGVISIGQWVDTTSDVTFNSITVATNTTTNTLDAGNLNITTNVISSDIAGDIRIESGSDNIELVGNTNVTGDLTVSGMIYGDLTGNVTGQVSDISNHTTTELTEGTNLYYTNTRARLSVSATDSGGDGSFSYNNATGVFTYTGPSASETQAHFSAGTGLTYDAGEFSITNTGVISGSYGNSSSIPVITINEQGQITSASTTAVAGVTDFTYDTTNGNLTIYTADENSFVATVTLDPFTTTDLTEGTNKYYTDARARLSVSATTISGFGDLSYDNASGVFSYTGPSTSEILGLLNAGTGVYYDSSTGTISIGQSVDTTSDVIFNNVDTVTLDAGNLNITTNVISSDIAGDIIIDSGADNIELIGNTNVTGDLAVSANTIIYGDLTVQGTTTSINSTDTEITDNVITLNQGETGAGVSRGTSGIEVARGLLFNASWKWNEITGRWEAKEGSNLTAIAVSEIDAGNLNMSGNTISSTDTNGNINLTPNGTGQVLYKNEQVATHIDAIAYAIVFGG